MPETGSLESRVQQAKKQLGIALEESDDEVFGTHVRVAIAASENALESLDALEADGEDEESPGISTVVTQDGDQ